MEEEPRPRTKQASPEVMQELYWRFIKLQARRELSAGVAMPEDSLPPISSPEPEPSSE